MRLLITGGGGFIGSAAVEAALQAGHQVRVAVRRKPMTSRPGIEQVVLHHRSAPVEFAAAVAGIDVIINCAGILRERRNETFDTVHFEAPRQLAEAGRAAGVKKFVQVSALGSTDDGPFITSKHRFDDWLLSSGIPCTVVRPSVVVSMRGSYGGSSLLRALSAFPGILFTPAGGQQRIQPVLLEDLAQVLMRCTAESVADKQIVYAVGPEPITLAQYLRATRAWLGLKPGTEIAVPPVLVTTANRIGDIFSAGPLGNTIGGMLERGNVAPPEAIANATALTGWRARSVLDALGHSASFVQDRWHARFYLLRPLVLATLAVIWIASGIAGFLATPNDWAALLTALGVPDANQHALVIAASIINLALGTLLVLRFRPTLILWLMLVAVTSYTVTLTIGVPSLWLAPLGGLLKNLAILPLIIFAIITEETR